MDIGFNQYQLRIVPHQCKLGGMNHSSNFQFKFSVCAVAPCVAVLCLSHPSCCQRADACGFERLVECASVGHALGSHGSIVSDPACAQLAGCAVPRHARDVAGPAKKTGAVVVERLQSNASVQRVLFDSVSTYLLLYLQRPSKSQRHRIFVGSPIYLDILLKLGCSNTDCPHSNL